MNEIKNKTIVEKNNEIRLTDLFRIFLYRKWIFTGFFLIVLIIGLLFTFVKAPLYKSNSSIKFSNIIYNDLLYEFFPVEAQKLDIYASGMKSTDIENSVLDKYNKMIKSKEVLNEIIKKVDFSLSEDDLSKAIVVLQDRSKRIFAIEVTYKSAQQSFEINKTLLEVFINQLKENDKNNIEELLSKIDTKITDINKNLSLTSQNTDNIMFQNSYNSILNKLEEIKYNLENNKEAILDKVEVIKEPNKPDEPFNLNYFKNLFIVFFASIAVGLIAVYLPEIFKRDKVQTKLK